MEEADEDHFEQRAEAFNRDSVVQGRSLVPARKNNPIVIVEDEEKKKESY